MQQNETAVRFTEFLVEKTGEKTLMGMARKLNLSQALVSNYRHGRQNIGATFIIRAHLGTGVPVAELLERAGIDPVNFKPKKADSQGE